MTIPGIGALSVSALAHPAMLLLALVPVLLLALYVGAQLHRARRLRRFSTPAAAGFAARIAPGSRHA